ncbi:MAG: hypothetical protein ACOZBW_08880 [Thermodesulfobacteriota bacterium]
MPERIAQYCLNHLPLKHATLSDEYFYLSLPFCVIDAVYSLGVKYSSTLNTVRRFCNAQGLERLRPRDSSYPDKKEQYSINQFEELFSRYDNNYEEVAVKLFGNRQRTSPKNGILKAEAVHKFTKILLLHHVNYFQDVPAVIQNMIFESDIKSIPGQTYGTSLKYFFMLAGEKNKIKPDRMIRRFLERIINGDLKQQPPEKWLSQALQILNKTYPKLTLRELDHEIWKYERSQ